MPGRLYSQRPVMIPAGMPRIGTRTVAVTFPENAKAGAMARSAAPQRHRQGRSINRNQTLTAAITA